MKDQEADLVVIGKVQGELTAKVIKSHLESEGIPVLLKWEAAGRVWGLTMDGLGEVSILVPREYEEYARHVIEPRESDIDKIEDNG